VLGAATALAALLAGMPAVLVAVAGWPLPNAVPTWQQISDLLTGPYLSDEFLIDVLACAGWVCWGLLTLSAVLDITAAVLRLPVPQIPGLRPAQALVGALIAALTVAPLLLRPADTLVQARPAITHSATHTVPTSAVDLTGTLTLIVNGTSYIHPVHPGDTLWDIADAWLGDPHRWPEIYRLNAGRHFPDVGGALTDPDLILPGWHLRLPGDARPPTSTSRPEPTPQQKGTVPRTATPPTGPTGTSPSTPPTTTRASSPTVPTTSEATPAPAAASAETLVPEPATAASTPEPTRNPQPTSADGHPGPGRSTDGVQLPGGWISLPFAAALAAAAALAWRRRSRRYRVDALTPPDPADAPDARALPDAPTAAGTHDPDADLADVDDPLPLPASVIAARRQVRRLAPDLLHPARPGPTVGDVAEAHRTGAPAPASRPPGPDGPVLAGLPTPLPTDGLALTGPGAPDAVRALLVATLTAGGPDDGDAQGHVVIPRDTWQRLLAVTTTADRNAGTSPVQPRPQPAPDPTRLPRLTVTTDLDEALTRIEADLIARRRLLLDCDAPDVAAYRTDPDHEPVPLTLLITAPPGPEHTDRLTAATRLGTDLNVATVILGPGTTTTTLTVYADGHLPTPAADGAPARLAVLDVDTALDLLHGLSGPPPAPSAQPSPAQPAPTAPPAAPTVSASPAAEPSAPSAAAASPTATGPIQDRHPTGAVTPPAPLPRRPAGPVPPGRHAPAPPTAAPHPARTAARVLGTPVILMPDGTPTDSVREIALELLTYLAVHRDGATIGDIKKALYPEATPDRARQRLSTDLANLRNRLRHAHPTTGNSNSNGTGTGTGDKLADPVINTGGHYHLNPDIVDVDWWHVQDAVTRTKQATTPHEQSAALTDALAWHHGPLADNLPYDWMSHASHHVRRTGSWIHARLAILLADSDPHRAAALLETACTQDPYDEELARLALQAHARTGNTTAVKTRMSRLRGALDELDEAPDERTEALAKRLLTDLGARRPTATQPRPSRP
jgi:DNA-binding SARP family transcriptional activator